MFKNCIHLEACKRAQVENCAEDCEVYKDKNAIVYVCTLDEVQGAIDLVADEIKNSEDIVVVGGCDGHKLSELLEMAEEGGE